MIYFIQADVVGHIKIGFTDGMDAAARLADLQVGSPVRLTLLGTMPGGKEAEADMHRRFAHAHVHGEWFRPEPDLLQLIGQRSAAVRRGPAEVQTRFVQIKVLTVNSKQFTTAMLRQLPVGDVVNALTGDLEGDPWGRINDFKGDCLSPGLRGDHLHIVWQCGSQLCRCCIDRKFPLEGAYQRAFALLPQIAALGWIRTHGFQFVSSGSSSCCDFACRFLDGYHYHLTLDGFSSRHVSVRHTNELERVLYQFRDPKTASAAASRVDAIVFDGLAEKLPDHAERCLNEDLPDYGAREMLHCIRRDHPKLSSLWAQRFDILASLDQLFIGV